MKKSALRRELRCLARDEAESGRAKLARIEALRLLQRLDRDGDVDYPVDDDGRYHPRIVERARLADRPLGKPGSTRTSGSASRCPASWS